MANRPDPNNPQPGDVFFNLDGDKRTIIATHDVACWVAFDGSEPAHTISTRYISKNWKPAPSTPPERWGVLYDDGAVITWSAEDMARNAVASERDTVLVHYVGTVVEP